jgi:hypothetical protein
LFAGCASQQVTAGPVHAQFAYVILFSAISSLAVRDVNGERFRFQVSIRCCRFNFSQGYRRQVNVRIAAWPLTETVQDTSVTLPKKLTWPPPTLVSAAWAAVMQKTRLPLLQKEKTFHCHFLVRVNYESMSTL